MPSGIGDKESSPLAYLTPDRDLAPESATYFNCCLKTTTFAELPKRTSRI
jgi:hypothetical protein